ncbi:hypothetical protein BLOT_000519 [Blomia tropicalis]|nr:hypothetical protein BLOT_000519 [Blomia tropicalis]
MTTVVHCGPWWNVPLTVQMSFDIIAKQSPDSISQDENTHNSTFSILLADLGTFRAENERPTNLEMV